ncbi:hypothetical protein BGY98DRAFT_55297 [Russula aff. rugulosa BPL654]|nr:hypothetical protein BGY98DRAFT_55297 [Russula aff. rugulosa BPL654]
MLILYLRTSAQRTRAPTISPRTEHPHPYHTFVNTILLLVLVLANLFNLNGVYLLKTQGDRSLTDDNRVAYGTVLIEIWSGVTLYRASGKRMGRVVMDGRKRCFT